AGADDAAAAANATTAGAPRLAWRNDGPRHDGPRRDDGSRHDGPRRYDGSRMLFALMDSDGDGTITLQEFQAAHERIFKAMDANKDGRLTLDEIQAFVQGTRRSAPQQ